MRRLKNGSRVSSSKPKPNYAVLESIRANLPQMREALRELPGVVKTLSDQIAEGNIRITMESPELDEIKQQLARQNRQRFLLGVGATAILGGTLALLFENPAWPGWVLVAVGAVALFRARPRT